MKVPSNEVEEICPGPVRLKCRIEREAAQNRTGLLPPEMQNPRRTLSSWESECGVPILSTPFHTKRNSCHTDLRSTERTTGHFLARNMSLPERIVLSSNSSGKPNSKACLLRTLTRGRTAYTPPHEARALTPKPVRSIQRRIAVRSACERHIYCRRPDTRQLKRGII